MTSKNLCSCSWPWQACLPPATMMTSRHLPMSFRFPVPEKYSFTKNGESTIDLTVPAIHIGMCMELPDEMFGYEHATEESMMEVWMNRNSPFSDPKLNAFDGSIRDFVASSPRPV